jgi:hypothetical protein
MQIDRIKFRSTLLEEVRAAWSTLRHAHSSEVFYAFGIYTTAVVDYLMVTASTEEGLTKVTAEYCARDGGDSITRRASLRWFPADSPLHMEGRDLLAKSEALRSEGPDPYDDSPEADEVISMVLEAAFEVLTTLDHEGVFGVGADRQRLVLNVWMGDQEEEERVEFANLLNPTAVAERFAMESSDGYRAFVELSSRAG